MLSKISRRCNFGSLKGKDGLANRFFVYRLFHRIRRREIDLYTEQIGEAVFEMRHADERETFRAVEIGHKIDV